MWQFLKTLNTLLQWDKAITLSIYSNAMKTYIHTKTCTQILVAVLLITALTWKQQKDVVNMQMDWKL